MRKMLQKNYVYKFKEVDNAETLIEFRIDYDALLDDVENWLERAYDGEIALTERLYKYFMKKLDDTPLPNDLDILFKKIYERTFDIITNFIAEEIMNEEETDNN